MVNNVFTPIGYNAISWGDLTITCTSGVDASGDSYVTSLDYEITSTSDVTVAVAFVKVATVYLFDEFDNQTYKLYFDAESIDSTFTLTNNSLTSADLDSKTVDGTHNVKELHDSAQIIFIDYFYNDTSFTELSNTIGLADNVYYEIIAKFASQFDLTLSMGIYYNNTLISGTEADYENYFNAPTSQLAINSIINSNTNVILSSIFNGNATATSNFSFATNDSVLIQIAENADNYFEFIGWFDNNGNLISELKTIPATTLSNAAEIIEARFNIITRTITLETNYPISNATNNLAHGSLNIQGLLLEEQMWFNLTTGGGTRRMFASVFEDNSSDNNYRYSIDLTYAYASSALGDNFDIVDTGFTLSDGNYYLTLGSTRFKFDNFTRLGGKIVATGQPSATINLSEFKQNQVLSVNTTEQFNIQYSIIVDDDADLFDATMSILINGASVISLSSINPAMTFSDGSALISVWVNRGDRVTIKASGDNLKTLGISRLNIIDNNDLSFNNIFKTLVQNFASQYGLDILDAKLTELLSRIIKITNSDSDYVIYQANDLIGCPNLTIIDILTQIFINVAEQITGKALQDDILTIVDSVSAYTFTALTPRVFIADYLPFLDYKDKFVNAILSATDYDTKITDILGSNLFSGGNTFGIKGLAPTENATFAYNSTNLAILSMLDRNNALVDLYNSSTIGANSGDLSYRVNHGDNAINSPINKTSESLYSRQTTVEDYSDSDAYSENGFKVVGEKLAEVTLAAGYINPNPKMQNAFVINPNKYGVLYEDLTNDILYGTFDQTRGLYNDVNVEIRYKDSLNTNQKVAHPIFVEFDNFEAKSFSQTRFKAGSKLTMTSTVINNLANWYFKGFVIVNSAATSEINLYSEGKLLTYDKSNDNYIGNMISSYNSYKIIPVGSSLINVDSDSLTGTITYSLNDISVDGDVTIIALYERVLLQVNVERNKLTSENQERYNAALASNDVKFGEIAKFDVDVLNDPISYSGKFKNSNTIVSFGETVTLNAISYPYASLIGWATDKNYSKEQFSLEFTNASNENVLVTLPTLAENKLVYACQDYVHNRLIISNVQENMLVAAYFSPASYVISFEFCETELVPYISGETTYYDQYISIVDDEGNLNYIETETDEYGIRLATKSKIPSRLIDVSKSLELVDNKRYLTYVTGNRVVDDSGDYVEVTSNFISSSLEINDSELLTRIKEIELTTNNFYSYSNIRINNCDSPSNISDYFLTYSDATVTNELRVRPGLISISLNNKAYVDLSLYDALVSEVYDEDNNIINYRASFVVNANASSAGYPLVKINFNSPSNNSNIIPYSFDNSDYIEKMSRTNENYYDYLNTKLQSNLITGFYNNQSVSKNYFNNTQQQTIGENFTLKLIYAKRSTPLTATVTSTSSSSVYNKTSKQVKSANLTTRGTDQAIEYVYKNISAYKFYIIKDGATLLNYIYNDILVSEAWRNGGLKTIQNAQAIEQTIEALTMLPKYSAVDAEISQKFSNDIKPSLFNLTSIATATAGINTVISIIKTYINSAFNPSLEVEVIDVFEWFTGLHLVQSLEDKLDRFGSSINEADELLNLYYSANALNVYSSDGTTVTHRGNTYTIGEHTSSSAFTRFFVNAGDSFITDVHLNLHCQPQTNYDKNGNIILDPYASSATIKKSNKTFLYYFTASQTFTNSEAVGKIQYTYDSDLTNTYNMLTNNISDGISSVKQANNIIAALNRCQKQFEGTYQSELVSSAALDARQQQQATQINNKTTIDENNWLPAYKFPWWDGAQPDYTFESIIMAAVTIVAVVATIVITVVTAGTGSCALQTVFIVLNAIKTGLILGAIVGLTLTAINEVISEFIFNVDWWNLGRAEYVQTHTSL